MFLKPWLIVAGALFVLACAENAQTTHGLKGWSDSNGYWFATDNHGRATVSQPNGALSFRTTAFGRQGMVEETERSGAVTRVAGKLRYDRGDIIEWYVHKPRGLEHGFDVVKRPTGQGPLQFDIALEGAQSVTSVGRDAVQIALAAGGSRLRYEGLKAWDARGRVLDSHMVARQDGISLIVSDTDAVYPLTVDPVITTDSAEIIPSDIAGNDYFGRQLSLDGDTAVFGVSGKDGVGNASGAAYVFDLNQGSWSETTKLLPSDTTADHEFGADTAVDDELIVVGAPGDTFDRGAAYVFERIAGQWTEVAKLTAPSRQPGDGFGLAVAIQEDTIAVGAPYMDSAFGDRSGALFVYERNLGGPDNWGLAQHIEEPGTEDFDLFAHEIKFDGDLLLASAHLDDDVAVNAGAVYMYERTSTTPYAKIDKFTASDGDDIDMFGWAFDIHDDWLVVGSRQNDNTATESGAVYLFEKQNNGDWIFDRKIIASDGQPNGWYGAATAINNRFLAVGARGGDITNFRGGVYVYDLDLDFAEVAKLQAENVHDHFSMGSAVGLEDDFILAGALGADVATGQGGAAYWFPRDLDGDGVEFSDNCPNDPNADQVDADSDGFGDVCDLCPNSAGNDDEDADGVCDQQDNCLMLANPGQEDTDSDGQGDACDACPTDPTNTDPDGDGVCGSADNCPSDANPAQDDSDSDGTGDVCDACPTDATNTDPDGDGVCGSDDNCPDDSNLTQADSDGDGAGDVCDDCPNDPDDDIDGDGVCAPTDNCPNLANSNQLDADNDGVGDACDVCPDDWQNDNDGDGICGNDDNCPTVDNPDQEDQDDDGIGDACDACPMDTSNDVDGDTICGAVDNCPFNWNMSQTDNDGDGFGNACDQCPADVENDADADSWCESNDNCPNDYNPNQRDSDFDGAGDACDICPGDVDNEDIDGDDICPSVDNCPTVSNRAQIDSDLDGIGDACDSCPGDPTNTDPDGDLVCGILDNCPVTANPMQADKDGDKIGDLCDLNKEGEAPRGCASGGSWPGVLVVVLLLGLVLRRRAVD